jgi:hypothetical protein
MNLSGTPQNTKHLAGALRSIPVQKMVLAGRKDKRVVTPSGKLNVGNTQDDIC